MTAPLAAHGAAAAVTFLGFNWVKGKLDAHYAASNHPVDYFTGQTSFSGETIKGYYGHMIEKGSLDIYWQTQLIDFGFILAIACMGFFVCTLIGRLGRPNSFGRRVAVLAGIAVIFGALCDAIENLLSFVLLTNPTDFPNWIALPYSGFASLKFALITIGMLAVIVSLILSVGGKIFGKSKLG